MVVSFFFVPPLSLKYVNTYRYLHCAHDENANVASSDARNAACILVTLVLSVERSPFLTTLNVFVSYYYYCNR